ncbi:MAG: hypothetical protein FJ082_11140 [Cyanobacteria bacterium K_Offshore_surface_m2_011]|nr:hypothetical protein [Cyanobacteria bacterium K_Offshore_surface_m2_011]
MAMKTCLMAFLSLALLMASLLIPSPVMALSNPLASPQTLLGAKTESVPASTQETDSQLQSAIGSVTDGGSQTEKKENTQERAKDGAKIDQMTQGLMKGNGA